MIVFKYKVKKKLENVQGDKIKNNGDWVREFNKWIILNIYHEKGEGKCFSHLDEDGIII